jgi:hypothetical protein
MALQSEALAGRVRARRVGLTVTGDVLANQGGEAARVDRLLNEAVAPDREARVAVALGRDGDDPDAAERGLAPEAQRHLVPVEAGDIEVHEHEIGAGGKRAADALEAVGRVDHLVSFGGQQFADEEAIRRVVLNVKNARHP